MDEQLFISGIGGQGVQLVGKTLALAAIQEGRHVMLTGDYGGQMRGGSSVGTVVIGSEPIRSLPVLPNAGAAIVLSHLFFEAIGSRLRPGSLVVAEETIAEKLPGMGDHRLEVVAGGSIAAQAGSRMALGMAMAGAYAALTGLVSVDSVVHAMKKQVPAYRSQHLETNERAIRAGAAAVKALAYPAALLSPGRRLDREMVA